MSRHTNEAKFIVIRTNKLDLTTNASARCFSIK